MKTFVQSLSDVLYKSRAWHCREQAQADLHPSVLRAFSEAQPKDWHLVVLQWPHVADDNTRLAYTQSDAKGIANLQTVTSIGKYLRQHWTQVPDHKIRDWAAAYSPDRFEIWTTREQIIKAVEFGPASCMQSAKGWIPFSSEQREWLENGEADIDDLVCHPYAAYDPDLGWSIAVRISEGRIDGRALLHDKVFVRSYGRPQNSNDRSETDHVLEAWLEGQGYKHRSGWPAGTKFALLDHPREGGYMMPYLDGSHDCVTLSSGCMVIDSDGEYECDNTDGTLTYREDSSIGTCHHCDDSIDEDDEYYHTGRSEEDLTCSHCAHNYFTFVRGSANYNNNSRRNYREYYIRDTYAEEVCGTDYSIDPDYVPDDIVQLEDGRYAEVDDTAVIEGEFYLLSDYRVANLQEEGPDGDMYALIDDTWVDGYGERHHDCHESWKDHNGKLWLMDEESEEVDGQLWRVCEIEEIRDAAQVAPLFTEV
jgi:hypothetical protein